MFCSALHFLQGIITVPISRISYFVAKWETKFATIPTSSLYDECKLQVFLLSRDHTLLEGTVNLVIFFFRGHCTDHLPLLVLQQPFLCLPSVSLCIFPRVFLSPLAIYPTYPLSPVNTSKLSTRCLLRIRVVSFIWVSDMLVSNSVHPDQFKGKF